MRRVVVTGMGIVSSIGNNTQEVLASLREAKSGISRAEDYAKLGFRCQVQGAPTLDASAIVVECPPFGFERDEAYSKALAARIREHGTTHLALGVGTAPLVSARWLADPPRGGRAADTRL